MSLSFHQLCCSLQGKIILIISSMTLFFAVMITIIIKQYIPPVIHANLEDKGKSITKHLAVQCVNYLLTDDLVAIYDLLHDTTENDEEIEYIFILDQENMPLIHTFLKKIPDSLLANHVNNNLTPLLKRKQLDEFGEVLDISLSITTHGSTLGTMRLGLTERHNVEIVDLFLQHFFVILFFTSLAGFLVALFFSQQILIKPIKDLMIGARRIGLGDKSHPISVTSNDEIGELASEFNTMANRLRAMDQSNRESLEQVRELHNYLSNIIDSMPSMLFGVNMDEEITLWNKKISKNTGISANISQGKKFTEIIPHLAYVDDTIKNCIKNRKIFKKPLPPHTTVNGTCYEELTIFPLIANGIDGAIVRIDDISQQKKMEDALQKANEGLEQRVSERTEELQLAHSKLIHSEKLAAIGSLSASIAHEFNNPLAGITNVICGIKRRAQYSSDDAILIDLAIKECERIRDLIKSLQDFNRPSRGKISPMNIIDAINSLLMLTKKEYSDKGIRIIQNYPPTIPPIMAISDQIKQVLLNLLNNAAFACETGDSITITTEAISENRIAIRIKDTGSGIEPVYMQHIFEPFFTTKPEVSGSGLGLSISYGIIKEHGGTFEVESTHGRGSTFSVILPLQKEDRSS